MLFIISEQGTDMIPLGDHHSREAMGMHLTAAMTAGASATILTNPMWVVKTRFMVRKAPKYYSGRNANNAAVNPPYETDSTS